ncbi:AI-2E family transporter [Longicatena caecimuris]|uniref:AI-2E family transporter n=1 Tax=Longicatena caecimuris TaxID=1796635 RepID=UPI0022E95811|nr:AI-2E family transporter [Longicatena caecimuris]
MKYKFHDEKVLHRIKPWVYLSTYILLLAFFLMHVQDVVNGFDFVLSLFRSLLYAIVFAYVLNLPMKKIESFIIRHTKETSLLRKRKRMVSMFLTFLIAFLLLIIIGSIILPSIIDSLISLMQNLSSFFTDIVKNIDEILKYFHIDYRIEDIQQVEQFIQMPWEKIVSNAIAFLSGSASGILSSASNFISSFAVGFTGFMFSLYLLSGKENFIRQLRKVTAAFCGYDASLIVFRYASRVNRIFSSFIGGQLTEACILWVLYYVCMRLFQFPYPELICTLIAVCSLVPVFGSMFAMSVGAVMMLSHDPLQSIWFIVFYQVISYFEDNVIYPRVVGNSVGLPGLWVLLSIFVFGDLWGVFGMVMAVPTTACLYVFFAEFINNRLRKKRLRIENDTLVQEEIHDEKTIS